MKIKDIEGTPDEIGQLCDKHDFSLNDYLHNKSNFKKWVLPSVCILYFLICLLLWTVEMRETFQRCLFLLAILSLGTFIIILHLKYGNIYVSSIASIFGLIMLSVSLNIITPKDAVKSLREKLQEANNNK